MTVCHNCEDREIGCHGYCERYLEEKRVETARKESIRNCKYNDTVTLPKKLHKTKHRKLTEKWARNYGV